MSCRQEIKLDSNITLLDSPGIIFSSGSVDADVILRNAIKVDQIEDPTYPGSLRCCLSCMCVCVRALFRRGQQTTSMRA